MTERTNGAWQYAVRETDEDGDCIIWTSWSSHAHEPFRSAQEARDFAKPWLDNFEVIRTWTPSPVWEVAPS